MTHRSKRKFLILVTALIFLIGAAVAVYAACEPFPNSRPAFIGGQMVCAYTGTGCTECVDGGGSSCVTNGIDCTPDNRY